MTFDFFHEQAIWHMGQLIFRQILVEIGLIL